MRVYELPTGGHCCKVKSFNEEDVNSIITNYYQTGPTNIQESVIIELLMVIFNSLG